MRWGMNSPWIVPRVWIHDVEMSDILVCFLRAGPRASRLSKCRGTRTILRVDTRWS
jgi:hypothetical protein